MSFRSGVVWIFDVPGGFVLYAVIDVLLELVSHLCHSVHMVEYFFTFRPDAFGVLLHDSFHCVRLLPKIFNVPPAVGISVMDMLERLAGVLMDGCGVFTGFPPLCEANGTSQQASEYQ